MPVSLEKTRGSTQVARPRTGVKSVAQMRPAACRSCGQASRPAGGKLGMHGHGPRARQVRGPLSLADRSAVHEIEVRRYRCTNRSCLATVTVAPEDVVRGRLYLASAIATAFVLVGVRRQSQRVVRKRLCAWQQWGEGSATRWDALGDWVGAVRDGRLFRCVRRPPDTWPAWQVAERAATTVAALVPPGAESLEAAAFVGAARAA